MAFTRDGRSFVNLARKTFRFLLRSQVVERFEESKRDGLKNQSVSDRHGGRGREERKRSEKSVL